MHTLRAFIHYCFHKLFPIQFDGTLKKLNEQLARTQRRTPGRVSGMHMLRKEINARVKEMLGGHGSAAISRQVNRDVGAVWASLSDTIHALTSKCTVVVVVVVLPP